MKRRAWLWVAAMRITEGQYTQALYPSSARLGRMRTLAAAPVYVSAPVAKGATLRACRGQSLLLGFAWPSSVMTAAHLAAQFN